MWRLGRSISKIPLDAQRSILNFFPIGSTQYFRRAVFWIERWTRWWNMSVKFLSTSFASDILSLLTRSITQVNFRLTSLWSLTKKVIRVQIRPILCWRNNQGCFIVREKVSWILEVFEKKRIETTAEIDGGIRVCLKGREASSVTFQHHQWPYQRGRRRTHSRILRRPCKGEFQPFEDTFENQI